jgi:hypothetical protein
MPRTFDYGFATALMVKDVRPVCRRGRSADFTTVTKPFEKAAGVTVGPAGGQPSGQRP